MNTKKFLISSVVVFVVVFLFDWLIHGVLLMPAYEATSHLWRTKEEHQCLYMILSQALFSILFVYIFTKNYENEGMAEGMRYGLYIGVILAVVTLGSYSYMPIPLSLVMTWMLAAIGKSVLAGAVVSKTYSE